MAYEYRRSDSLLAEMRQDAAFNALEVFLGKIAPFATQYEAVIAEGQSATIPALGAYSLITEVRRQRGLLAPVSGHIKTTGGPESVYPEMPTASILHNRGHKRYLLVTEVINSGTAVLQALKQLRSTLPRMTLIDVATLAHLKHDGLEAVGSRLKRPERLIVGDAENHFKFLGWSYFYHVKEYADAGETIQQLSLDSDRDRAVQLGKSIADEEAALAGVTTVKEIKLTKSRHKFIT